MEYKVDGEVVVIILAGRIDATNANEIEENMFGICDSFAAGNIVIDAEELQYISSAGLRILLKLEKQKGPVKVINVLSDVYEIFETTGFTDILKIEKALKRVSIEGLSVIGKGATGKVYRLDEERILKVYIEHMYRYAVENEKNCSRKAFVAGVPTVIPFDVVRVGEQYGIIYELLDSSTLANRLNQATDDLDEIVDRYIYFLKSIKDIDYKPELSWKKMYGKLIEIFLDAKMLDETEVEAVNGMLDKIPDADSFLHGDPHPANVMMNKDEMMLIDMITNGYGHPLLDLVASSNYYYSFPIYLSEEEYAKRFGLGKEKARLIWEKITDRYFEGCSEEYKNNCIRMINILGQIRIYKGLMNIDNLIAQEQVLKLRHDIVEGCKLVKTISE